MQKVLPDLSTAYDLFQTFVQQVMKHETKVTLIIQNTIKTLDYQKIKHTKN